MSSEEIATPIVCLAPQQTIIFQPSREGEDGTSSGASCDHLKRAEQHTCLLERYRLHIQRGRTWLGTVPAKERSRLSSCSFLPGGGKLTLEALAHMPSGVQPLHIQIAACGWGLFLQRKPVAIVLTYSGEP